MERTMTAWATCKVCGNPVRWDNQYGICKKTPACNKARYDTMQAGFRAGKFTADGPCSVEGCDQPRHARGLCSSHDRRMRKYGNPGPARRRAWNRTKIGAGDVFGRWTALGEASDSRQFVPCRCECGLEREVRAGALMNGISGSCGGCGRRHPQKRTVPYITAGTVFGRLTALEEAWKSADQVRFLCECGSVSRRTAASVKSSGVRSCECVKREAKTHGLSKHPLYATWKAMIDRTTNPDAHNYPLYGGRGIRVCERWLGPDGLENFISDVGTRPAGRTLDRIEVDGNYEPGNVKWSTKREQAENKRKVGVLTAQRDALLALVLSQPDLAAQAKEALAQRG